MSEEDLLPRYVPRVGESEPVKRARLLYQSRYGKYAWPNHHRAESLKMNSMHVHVYRKRGMLENGLLLRYVAIKQVIKLLEMEVSLMIIGASLSEPHINGTALHEIYVCI